ncbi:hypothetical protein [Youngiibacter fragilis]|uniref:Uncharacterized protein n=1 Tax=Youngiibacter fragilis 232.1 TaxID=994573 RepID=V7I736_9CLOT|nr:hypothetical protein [Youngiibacter fragilis]ETA80827.1 hypothetical protein T472_0209640 [Youngiibacter fragilis 232.1]
MPDNIELNRLQTVLRTKENLITRLTGEKEALLSEKAVLANQVAQHVTTIRSLEREKLAAETRLNGAIEAEKRLSTAKDNQILKLQEEKTSLFAQVSQNLSQIQSLQQEKKVLENSYKVQMETERKAAALKDAEISRLKETIAELSRGAGAGEEVLKELTSAQLNLTQVTLHDKMVMQQLVEAQSMNLISEDRIRRLGVQVEDLTKTIAELQLDRTGIRAELEILRKRFETSFSAEELSGYLNSAVDTFNMQENTSDPNVNYIINGLDLQLKAKLFKDDQDRMMLTGADVASKSENTISTLNISIRAVPKI